jgi:hypothetical protein
MQLIILEKMCFIIWRTNADLFAMWEEDIKVDSKEMGREGMVWLRIGSSGGSFVDTLTFCYHFISVTARISFSRRPCSME